MVLFNTGRIAVLCGWAAARLRVSQRPPYLLWLSVERHAFIALVLMLNARLGFGQQLGMIGGYVAPGALSFAPGQIGTIYVFGVDDDLYPPNGLLTAASLPLPTELGGISVLSRMAGDPPFDRKSAILSIGLCCRSGKRMGLMITLQWPGPPSVSTFNTALAVVVAKGAEIASEAVSLTGGPPRVLSGGCPARPPTLIPERNDCNRNLSAIVTHADGALVSRSHPARGGETIVVYAVGLYPADVPAPIGVASPSPAVAINSVLVSLDFAYDGGRNPRTERFIPPEFAGLTPGAVGLYQIHVTVPEVPPETLACTEGPGAPVPSNLSIAIRSGFETDRIGVCVEPSSPTGKASLEMPNSANDAPRFDPTGFPIGYPGVQ